MKTHKVTLLFPNIKKGKLCPKTNITLQQGICPPEEQCCAQKDQPEYSEKWLNPGWRLLMSHQTTTRIKAIPAPASSQCQRTTTRGCHHQNQAVGRAGMSSLRLQVTENVLRGQDGELHCNECENYHALHHDAHVPSLYKLSCAGKLIHDSLVKLFSKIKRTNTLNCDV